MIDHKKNATAGANLMDEKRPGWYRTIDKDSLEMDNPCKCILGQNYGSYGTGVVDLGLAVYPIEDEIVSVDNLGFDLDPIAYGYNPEQEDVEFNLLKQAWIEEIDKRLELDAEMDSLLSNEPVLATA